MINKIIIGLLVVAVLAALGSRFMGSGEESVVEVPSEVACTMDAMQCPDGSLVGRTGPDCAFVCPPAPVVPDDIQVQIDAKADLIVLDTPVPLGVISSPLTLAGEARGMWYFEGDFPVVLTNWDGLIIAEGFVTAQGEWMTEELVPFAGSLDFVSPYNEGDSDFMKNGSLILQKDNPSGLPEHDDALEIPVRFAP